MQLLGEERELVRRCPIRGQDQNSVGKIILGRRQMAQLFLRQAAAVKGSEIIRLDFERARAVGRGELILQQPEASVR